MCIAAVHMLLCDMPSDDLSRDRTALSGDFVEDELKAGRKIEFRNMLHWMSCFKENTDIHGC